MRTLKEKIAVMQAALDGKIIKSKHSFDTNWEIQNPDDIAWNWADYDYKIDDGTLCWVSMSSSSDRKILDIIYGFVGDEEILSATGVQWNFMTPVKLSQIEHLIEK